MRFKSPVQTKNCALAAWPCQASDKMLRRSTAERFEFYGSTTASPGNRTLPERHFQKYSTGISIMTSSPFHAGELDAQQRWGNPELWTEARINQLIWDRIPEAIHARIEAAPFFFLATSSPDGRCDCSFKGGGPGLVKVLSPNRLAFPHFEARVKGNGVYASLGNILLNPYVSILL